MPHVVVVVVVPPIPLPGRQPLLNSGVPPTSMYFAMIPTHPRIGPFPASANVCLGR